MLITMRDAQTAARTRTNLRNVLRGATRVQSSQLVVVMMLVISITVFVIILMHHYRYQFQHNARGGRKTNRKANEHNKRKLLQLAS